MNNDHTTDQIREIAYLYWKVRQNEQYLGSTEGDWLWAENAIKVKGYQAVVAMLAGSPGFSLPLPGL